MSLSEEEKRLLELLKTESRLKRNELAFHVLNFLDEMKDAAVALSAYNTKSLYRYLLGPQKRRLSDTMKRLISKGYVRCDRKRCYLTAKGSIYINKAKIVRITPRHGKWDKKWRMILFDIPEHKKAARVALRRKIIDWGFVGVQKSVFIGQLECKREIEQLKEFFDLDTELILIEIDDNKELRKVLQKAQEQYV